MTIIIQWFIIPLLSLLDMLLTYLIMSCVKNKYHDKELNIIIKTLWKKFGLKNGSLIAGILIFILVIFISLNIENDFKLLFVGAYSVVIYLHYNNLCLLFSERKKKKSNILLKRFMKK